MKLGVIILYVVLVAAGFHLYNVNAVPVRVGGFLCSGIKGICSGKDPFASFRFQPQPQGVNPVTPAPAPTPAPTPLSKLPVRTDS